ncbi:hypothetical protein [Acinetobacter populi]|nr:hypothetical protein [Acinetobacter populi]
MQLENIFASLDMDVKIEIDKQILRPKQIIWHRISNTFESKVDTSLQVLKFKLENPRMREVVSNILDSLQFIHQNNNVLFFADYIENVLKQIDEIVVEDDLKLLEEKESIRKVFLYHIAKIIRKKELVIVDNIRHLTADQVKNFILEVYIKHQILGYWYRPLSSFEVQQEKHFFFKYYIRKEQKIRKFAVVKTSRYYFFLAPGKKVEENIYSIRRFLTEQVIEYNNKTYIFGLVLPLNPAAEKSYIDWFKSLMEKMVTIEYKVHKTVIDIVAQMEFSFSQEITPLFIEPIALTEKNLDLVISNHILNIENVIVEKILTPLKRALEQDLTHQDEYDFVFHSLRNMFQEMLNCFDVFKQQPLLIFNHKIQEFGYRLLSYLKLLERRRDELFVPLSAEEYKIVNRRAQAPIEALYHAIQHKLEQYLALQLELKEVERTRVKRSNGGMFSAFLPKQKVQKSYGDLFHDAMLLKKMAYQDLLFIPRQYKKYCVMIQDENLMSIQGCETYYAFSNGENGINLLPILFHIQNDLTDFSIEKIFTTLNQAMVTYNPFSPQKDDGFFIES